MPVWGGITGRVPLRLRLLYCSDRTRVGLTELLDNPQVNIRQIEYAFGNYSPSLIDPDGTRQAAVAMILRQSGEGPEMLFIQRAESVSDPWSGQIAFPGGGRESQDVDLMDTAIRETVEEIGVRLEPAWHIGRLDDQTGRVFPRRRNLLVACMVFHLERAITPMANKEVADIFWTPLEVLGNRSHQIDHTTDLQEEPYPAIHLGQAHHGKERILWGLTYRFVMRFLDILNT